MPAMGTPTHTNSAGGIVLGTHGTIALVRNRPGTDWFFPKGTLEGEESAEDAAVREIAEETGLTTLEFLDDLGAYERPAIRKDGTYDPDVSKKIQMFLFSVPNDTELTPSHEILDAVWMPYREVADALEDAKDRAWFASVFERVREAVQRD